MQSIYHPGLSLINELRYKRTGIGAPLTEIGHYAGIVDLGGDIALGITTDGVGSKVMIANYMHRWDTVGIDCIAMNVNDLLAMGIRPISFVDYIAIDKPETNIMEKIGEGLNKGAQIANISIVGGETAIMPDIINGFDLVGMCVGIVKKDKIITGDKIKIGDAIVGLPSTGVHSNGYSLVREIIKDYMYQLPYPYNDVVSIGDELLKPTKIYIEILDILNKFDIHGFAHITGGGLMKLHRITKYGFNFTNPLEPQDIFKFLQLEGDVEDVEMYKTFNMGMGFVIVLPKDEAEEVAEILGGKVVGEIIENGIYVKDTEIK